MNVTVSEVMGAHQRIAPHIIRTPLVYSPPLSAALQAEVWFKPEHWQLTGSFKIRGALNKMLQLSAAERARGVITASAGNHAQGVALAARQLGISALVVTPESTPATKLHGIRAYGAEVRQMGAHYDEAETMAYQLAETTGRVFVHAFEDADIVAGQGTVGWEMFQDQPRLDAVLVPAGGGGLITGIGVVARALRPAAAVVGVQSEASPAWHAAFQAGAVVDVTYQDTWAEGLLGGIGRENFALATHVVDRFALVSEEQIRDAMRWALETHHWVLEGSGAVALARVLIDGPAVWKNQCLAIVLTGGNLDTARLRTLLQERGS